MGPSLITKKCFFAVITCLSVKFDIYKGSTKSPEIMALVRMLYYCAALFNIHVMIMHIAGISNQIAIALSRFQATHFRQLAPMAEPLPHLIHAWPTQFWSDSSMNTNPLLLPLLHIALIRLVLDPTNSFASNIIFQIHSHCAISAPPVLSKCHARQSKFTLPGYL